MTHTPNGESHIEVGTCPTCSHFPTQFTADGPRALDLPALLNTPNGEREAAEWLNMLAAQLERPSRCGMYRNIPGLSAGQVYDIAQDMRSAIALLQSPAAPSFTTGHCENHKQPGGCQLHNLQCGWPKCDQRPVQSPAERPSEYLARVAEQSYQPAQSPAAVQQGEASVSTLPDLYWHITRNALRDGSPFAVACMGALPALNAAIATPSPASPEVGGLVVTEEMVKAACVVYDRYMQDVHGSGNECDEYGIRAALTAVLAPSRQAGGEAVAWQTRFATEDGSYWSGWTQTVDEERARKQVAQWHEHGYPAEYRPLYTHPAPSAESAFVRVPREPTPEMVFAGSKAARHSEVDGYRLLAIYRAMLAAAPTATDEGKAL